MPKIREIDKEKKDNNPVKARHRSRSAVNTLKGILTQDHEDTIQAQNAEIARLRQLIEKMQQDMALMRQQIPQQQHKQQQQPKQQRQQQKPIEQIDELLQRQKRDQQNLYLQQQQQQQRQQQTHKGQQDEHCGITTSNMYEALQGDMEDENINIDLTIEDARMRNEDFPEIGSRQQKKTTTTQRQQQTPRPDKTRLPPINISSVRGQQITEILQGLKIKDFTVRRTGIAKHTLQMENIEDFRKVRTKLQELSIQHFTYTPAQDKNKAFILRGLDGDEDSDHILNELNSQNVTNVQFVKVSKFNSRQKENTLFLVQISPSSDESMLFKVNRMNRTIIRWEKIKRTEIIQCYRCQRLGHSAANCGMEYRCVKCKTNGHGPGECELPKGVQHDAHKIYCVSCQAYGHPASYRGCPKIKEYIESRKDAEKRQQTNRVSQREFNNSLVKRGMLYSSAMGHEQNAPNHNYSRAVGAEKRSDIESLKIFFTQSLTDLNTNIQNRMNQLTKTINEISGRTDFIFDNFCHNE